MTATIYKDRSGKRVPSVTTILSRFKESGGLLHWAWNLGIEGKDYRAERDKAADSGTLVHEMIDRHFSGKDPFAHHIESTAECETCGGTGKTFASDDGADAELTDCLTCRGAGEISTEPIIAAANRGFDSFSRWIDQTRVKILDREEPFVSEEMKIGGTPDAIGTIDGRLCLLDWKTGNSVYSDHLLQVAAYRAIWEENHPGEKIVGGFHLLRFSKENADFAHRYFAELDEALELFKMFRRAYDLDKKVRKRVG